MHWIGHVAFRRCVAFFIAWTEAGQPRGVESSNEKHPVPPGARDDEQAKGKKAVVGGGTQEPTEKKTGLCVTDDGRRCLPF